MKILEVFGEPISNGGQESFVMNTVWHMDRTGLEIDYVTPYYCDNDFYRERIVRMGGEIFSFGLEFVPGKSRWNIYKPLKKVLGKKSYDVVHIHSGSVSVLSIAALAAKRMGVEKIITHSHCAAEHKNLKYYIAKYSCMPLLAVCPNIYCACSQVAGDWKYSRKVARNKLHILKNGVDLELFHFDSEVSLFMREKMGIEKEDFVVGHVGRFSYQKNHEFLIDIFRELKNRENHCKLMLVGTGEEQVSIIQKVEKYGLKKDVIFCGNVNNVQDYMKAMDIFVLPSRYEGLPIVGVEAQASGLPVITSDQVSSELKMIDEVEFLPLEAGAAGWAETILKFIGNPRVDSYIKLQESGYDIHQTAQTLREMYMEW